MGQLPLKSRESSTPQGLMHVPMAHRLKEGLKKAFDLWNAKAKAKLSKSVETSQRVAHPHQEPRVKAAKLELQKSPVEKAKTLVKKLLWVQV